MIWAIETYHGFFVWICCVCVLFCFEGHLSSTRAQFMYELNDQILTIRSKFSKVIQIVGTHTHTNNHIQFSYFPFVCACTSISHQIRAHQMLIKSSFICFYLVFFINTKHRHTSWQWLCLHVAMCDDCAYLLITRIYVVCTTNIRYMDMEIYFGYNMMMVTNGDYDDDDDDDMTFGLGNREKLQLSSPLLYITSVTNEMYYYEYL